MKLKKGLHPQTLRKNGFNKHGDTEWTKIVPLYSYKKRVLITLNMSIDTEEKQFTYTVLDHNTGSVFTSYYVGSPVPNEVLDEVNMKVDAEINKLYKVGILE